MVGKCRPTVEHMVAAEKAATSALFDIDPHNIRARLRGQTSRALEIMENMPNDEIEIKTFLYSIIQMWRMEAIGVALRKEKLDEPNRGSSVRKYAAAFKTNGTGGRKTNTGQPKPEHQPESEPDLESILDDDDESAVA